VPIQPLIWQVSAHEETIKHLRILLKKSRDAGGIRQKIPGNFRKAE